MKWRHPRRTTWRALCGRPYPAVRDMPGGCTAEALDMFKEIRAKFSLEVGSGALPEAVLDLGGCDYSGMDLTGRVLSGVLASNANFGGGAPGPAAGDSRRAAASSKDGV